MLRACRLAILGVTLGVLVVATPARAQFGMSPESTFFPAVPVRGPVVLYPTFTVAEEYNDNIFLDNNQKRSDWITSFTPGVRLILESPTYRWAAGYSFTAEKYVDNTELDNAIQRQYLFVTGSHRIDPRLTLTLSELFVEDNNSNMIGEEVISIGRVTSRSNTLIPGVTWQITPKTALRSTFSYMLQRFDDPGAFGSNVYRLAADVLHDVTPRLTGIFGYELAYIDVERQLGVTTHTPRIGATYRFTPTLTGSVLAGPTIRVSSRETDIRPFATASLTERFAWGAASVYFSRYVGTAGGLGDASDNTSLGATVQVTELIRDLSIEVGPRYGVSQSTIQGGNDVRSFTVALRAAYQFTPWLAGMIGYRFFQQRVDASTSQLVRDVDQNRVFFGLQLGVPFRFDRPF